MQQLVRDQGPQLAAVQHSAASQIANMTERFPHTLPWPMPSMPLGHCVCASRFEADRARFDAKLKEYFKITENLKAQRDEARRETQVWKSRALRDVVRQ